MARIDLTGIALGIIVLGVTVTIGVVVLSNMRNNSLTSLPTYQVANETLTTVTASGEILSNPWVVSVNTCINATTSSVIPTTNYTYTSDAVLGYTTVYSTGGLSNNSNWKCSYTRYNTSDPRWATADSAATGLGEYGNWFKILVIVGVAALVLGIIFMAFGSGGNNSSSGSGSSSSGGMSSGVAY